MIQAFKHEIEVKFRVNLWLSSFVECHRLLDEMKESVNYLNSHNVNVIEFEKMVFSQADEFFKTVDARVNRRELWWLTLNMIISIIWLYLYYRVYKYKRYCQRCQHCVII